MSQKTIRKHLLYESSLSATPVDSDVERDRRGDQKKINKNVHYSTSDLKKAPIDYKELSTKEHRNIVSAPISTTQKPSETTKKKEHGKMKNNRNRARQDLEIMKIFTSPEWSRKTFQKTTNPVVNSIIVNNDSIPLIHAELDNVSSKTYNEAESMEDFTDRETELTADYVGEQKIDLVPQKSFESVRQFSEAGEKDLESNPRESMTESIVENRNSMESFEESSINSKAAEHEYDVSFETPEDDNIVDSNSGPQPSYITRVGVEASEKTLKEVADESSYGSNEGEECKNQVENECYSYAEECRKEQETSPEHNSAAVSTPDLSSDEILDVEALMQFFNFDNFSDSHDNSGSEIVDPSPTGSLNTDVMTRIIRQNKSRNYMTEKQMSNESAFTEAMNLIFEETKASLGTLLVEGLCIVSKRHRQDSFKFLGKWLLIQADIRDENNHTKEESGSSSFSAEQLT